MSKNLRSAVQLPGSIRDYFLENQETMTSPPPRENSSSQANIQSMLSELSGDPAKLCELLVKNLTMATESNNQMQKILESQTRSRSGMKYSVRLDDCPTKGKYSSLDAWLEEVQLWDDTNVSSDDLANTNAKKYLKFMNSVKDSEECDELKKLVQVEFKENQSFNKKSETIIKDIIAKIKEKLDKSDLEKCSEAWVKFIDIKQQSDESAQSFVVRFEGVETQLRNVKINIPNKALAIHLLNRSNLETQSKENVLTKTNLDDEKEIYQTLKKSVREMKSKLTQNDLNHVVEEEKAKDVEKKAENKTFFGERERSRGRHFSRGRDRYRSYSKGRSDGYSDGKRFSGENRGRKSDRKTPDEKPWRNGASRNDSRGYRRSNGRSGRDSWRRNERSGSRYEGRRNGRSNSRHEERRGKNANFSSGDEEK